MGQLLNRLGRFFKSEIGESTASAESYLRSDEDELKRIIDELNNPQSRKPNSEAGERKYNTYSAPKNSVPADELNALRILGLGADANNAAIKSAYKKLMKLHHPDKSAGLGETAKAAAERKSADINGAYSLLRKRRGF